ncbi:MAG: RluA family pseudouridine synthase [Bacteroidia bacterium]|nr:RluA family pseudouridine synthase [Bacteroidia bacterium]HQV00349.1 RluA family pseudouridine synthase [Bacteroidia bacterium]
MNNVDTEQEQEELYEHHRIVVDKGQSLLRIDKFLGNRLENTSRNKIQTAAATDCIRVNDKPVKPSYKVKPGDVITIVFSHPPRDIELYADAIPLNIVYEDDQVIVINKPAGMVVHPAYGNYRNTLVNALVHHFHPHLGNAPLKSETLRPGLVHRIDKNTSGLMVVAKDEYSLSFLAKQFFDRTIERKYIALTWGTFEHDKGTITGYVGRNLKNRKIMDVFTDEKFGKHAVTHYTVLERLGPVTLLQCKLETGRTHQIRVHMKYIKHPLFNDAEYGGDAILKGTVYNKYKQFVQNCFDLLPRQALHAASLGFMHPITKKLLFFEAALPTDFDNALQKWRQYAD